MPSTSSPAKKKVPAKPKKKTPAKPKRDDHQSVKQAFIVEGDGDAKLAKRLEELPKSTVQLPNQGGHLGVQLQSHPLGVLVRFVEPDDLAEEAGLEVKKSVNALCGTMATTRS